ncbi:MAG: hypothetical protein ACRBI6_09010 [Acidimicrobiales bacterium]
MSVHPALRSTVALLAVLVGLAVAIPLLVLTLWAGMPWWPVPILAIGVGVVTAGVLVQGSLDRVIESFGPLAPTDDERLSNLVEGLSLSLGLDEPELFVIADKGANAAAVADGDRSMLIVTDRLLGELDRMCMEGVVAELLVRIKDGDAVVATQVAGILAPRMEGPLAPVLGGIARKAMADALDTDRDLLADQAAAAATRYPPGLAAALATIDKLGARTSATNRQNDHLWIAPSLGDEAVIPHVPLEWRVDMLLEI